MHITFTWKEEWWEANHDIYYMKSSDNGFTWNDFQNSQNKIVNPVSINTEGITAFEIPVSYGMTNQTTQVLDKNQAIHMVTYHRDQPGDSLIANYDERRLYYYSNSNGHWERAALAINGSRPELWYSESMDKLFLAVVDYSNSGNASNKYSLYMKEECDSCWKKIFASTNMYFSDAILMGYEKENSSSSLFLVGQQFDTTMRYTSLDLMEININSSKILSSNKSTEKLAAIYPNPTSDALTIGLNGSQTGKIEIVTLGGKALLKSSFQNERNVKLNTELAPGTYILILFLDSGEIYSNRIIILE